MPLSVAFRVLTLNLLHEPESRPERAPLVEAELLALAPDVVLLQEVASGRMSRRLPWRLYLASTPAIPTPFTSPP